MGMLLGVLEAAKRALDLVPNVELVTLLLVVYTIYFGKRTYIIAFAFTALEIFFWGPHVWVIMYLYVWPLLVTIVLLIRRRADHWHYCLLSAGYGFCFGALCSVPYLFIGGPRMLLSWWIAGIPYDLIHGISNFLLCLVLFRPLSNACVYMQRVTGTWPETRPDEHASGSDPSEHGA